MDHSPSTPCHIVEAQLKANDLFKSVVEKAKVFCSQGPRYNRLQIQLVLDELFEIIAKHNALPYAEVKYEFTAQFKAMMAIRVACFTAPMFDHMSQSHEEKHGMQIDLNVYKHRVFQSFKNTVKNKSDEMAAVALCDALRGNVMECVKSKLEKRLVYALYQRAGQTKYDFIIRMLEDIAQMESTDKHTHKKNFDVLREYINYPEVYATGWLKEQIFSRSKRQSLYSELVEQITEELRSNIESSASAATESRAAVDERERYNAWITTFCEGIKGILPLDADKLRLDITIASLVEFQRFLKSELKRLKTNVIDDFSKVNEDSVEWEGRVSPEESVFQGLWGCNALCPFCNEPCKHSVPTHRGSHSCVQHRPTGIQGVTGEDNFLNMETCTSLVASNKRFSCADCSNECRTNRNCTGKGKDLKKDHQYKLCKSILPHWDIAPDHAGTEAKYWQWVMCTFEKQILQYFTGSRLKIPESWKDVTRKQAIDSLTKGLTELPVHQPKQVHLPQILRSPLGKVKAKLQKK